MLLLALKYPHEQLILNTVEFGVVLDFFDLVFVNKSFLEEDVEVATSVLDWWILQPP